MLYTTIVSVSVPDNTVDKWSILSYMLDSLYVNGLQFIQLGEARDAKCYLQQGLKISQVFHIPRR